LWSHGFCGLIATGRGGMRKGPKPGELWMTRFSGLEVYPIESARWNLSRTRPAAG
jgi:hypothetical protein